MLFLYAAGSCVAITFYRGYYHGAWFTLIIFARELHFCIRSSLPKEEGKTSMQIS